jgi:hypothetical protein
VRSEILPSEVLPAPAMGHVGGLGSARVDAKFRDTKFHGNFMKFHKLLRYGFFSPNVCEIFAKICKNYLKIAKSPEILQTDYKISRNFAL